MHSKRMFLKNDKKSYNLEGSNSYLLRVSDQRQAGLFIGPAQLKCQYKKEETRVDQSRHIAQKISIDGNQFIACQMQKRIT